MQESVTWLTDSGKMMRENYEFYSEIRALSQERSQIKTIIDNYEKITTFQAKLSSLDLENQNFIENFAEIMALEKISQVSTENLRNVSKQTCCRLNLFFELWDFGKNYKKVMIWDQNFKLVMTSWLQH